MPNKFGKCESCACNNQCANCLDRSKTLVFEGRLELRADDTGAWVRVLENFCRVLVGRFGCDFAAESFVVTQDDVAANPDAMLALRQIARSLHRGITSEMYYESKVTEMLFYLNCDESGVRQTTATLGDDDLKAVNAVRDIIFNQLYNCPKIGELAAMTHTCPTKLQKDFKKAFGCTIHDFAQTERMRRAAEMLASSTKPIYMIAQTIGCKKAGRFSEIFRNAYGVTPSEYREQFNG